MTHLATADPGIDYIEGITRIRRCKRCKGAFYGSENVYEWRFAFCDDCWEIAADEWIAEANAREFGGPPEYICVAWTASGAFKVDDLDS